MFRLGLWLKKGFIPVSMVSWSIYNFYNCSVIIFLSQMTLLKWLTFLLGSQTVIFIVLLFWIYFFLLMLVFVLQWLSLHWETELKLNIDFLNNWKQLGVYLKFLIFKMNCRMFQIKTLHQFVKDSFIAPWIIVIKNFTCFKRTLYIQKLYI